MSGEGMQKIEKRSKELKSSKAEIVQVTVENGKCFVHHRLPLLVAQLLTIGDLDREEKKKKNKSVNKLAADFSANSEGIF